MLCWIKVYKILFKYCRCRYPLIENSWIGIVMTFVHYDCTLSQKRYAKCKITLKASYNFSFPEMVITFPLGNGIADTGVDDNNSLMLDIIDLCNNFATFTIYK